MEALDDREIRPGCGPRYFLTPVWADRPDPVVLLDNNLLVYPMPVNSRNLNFVTGRLSATFPSFTDGLEQVGL